MKLSIAGVMNFNMFGIPMVGPDTCGFFEDKTLLEHEQENFVQDGLNYLLFIHLLDNIMTPQPNQEEEAVWLLSHIILEEQKKTEQSTLTWLKLPLRKDFNT